MHPDDVSVSVPSPPTLHDLDVFSEQFESLIATANAMDVGFQCSQSELLKLCSLDNAINGFNDQTPIEQLIDSLPIVSESPIPSLFPVFEFSKCSPFQWRLSATTSSLVHISQSWDGHALIMSSFNLAVYFRWEWLPTPGPKVIRLPGQSAFSRVSAFHPSDRLAALTKYDRVFLYDIASGQMVGSLTPHSRTITGAAFSSDGRALVTAAMDAKVVTQDLIRNRADYSITLDAYPTALTVSDDGAIVAAALANGDVALFETRTDKATATIEGVTDMHRRLSSAPPVPTDSLLFGTRH
jgi:WD40 repeat protein